MRAFTFIALYLTATLVVAKSTNEWMRLPQPKLVADHNQIHLQREAKISAEEFPLAQQIRPLLQAGDYTGALKVLTQHSQAKSAALLLLEAQLYMQDSRWKQAKTRLLDAIKKMPQLMRAHLALSTVYQAEENYDQARQSLAKAVALGAVSARHYALLGYLHMQNQNAHAAVAAYQQSLMLEPENKDTRQGLLFALAQSQQLQAASAVLAEMLNEQPSNPKLWLQRANLALQANDPDIALSSVEVALRLGEKGAASRQLAMQLQLKQQHFSRAFELAKSLINQGKLAFTETDKLMTYLAQKQQWSWLEKLITSTQKNAKGLNNLQRARLWQHKGQLALHRGKRKTATRAWRKAVELDPGNAQVLLLLAKQAADNQQYAQAELYYQRAETSPVDKMAARLGRAQLYIDQLDYAAALKLLESLLKTHPQRSDLRENIRILTSLVNNKPR